MKAILYSKYGKSDVLEFKDVQPPLIKSDEIRFRNHAASVNPVDWKIRSGILRFIPLYKFPINPGMDAAGEIVEVGSEVGNLKKGDRVFAFLINRGGYAEYVTVKADKVVKIPENTSYEQAACVPLAGITSLRSFRLGNLKKGDKILINGAAGGVGFIACQIAKDLGAEVTAVCRKENFEFVAQTGSDHLIDHQTVDFTKQNEKYDLVYDVFANKTMGQCLRIMKPKATMVTTMPNNFFLGFKILSFFMSKKIFFVLAKENMTDMQYLADLFEQGKLITHIEHRFPLKDAAAAMDMNQFGRVKGKVILTME